MKRIILFLLLIISIISFSETKQVELFRERNNFQTLLDISQYELKYELEGYKMTEKEYKKTDKGLFITLTFEKKEGD